jgi:hypothetical protein
MFICAGLEIIQTGQIHPFYGFFQVKTKSHAIGGFLQDRIDWGIVVVADVIAQVAAVYLGTAVAVTKIGESVLVRPVLERPVLPSRILQSF